MENKNIRVNKLGFMKKEEKNKQRYLPCLRLSTKKYPTLLIAYFRYTFV
jgi:hypothetical protein